MVVTVIDDPAFLDEPFIRTSNFVLSLPSNANAWGNCGLAQIVDELGGRPKGSVPHYLPGETSHIEEFLARSGVPAEAARGGAETTYPEYMLKLAGGDLHEGPSPPVSAESAPPVPRPIGEAVDGLRILPVQGNVYVLAGAGGNMAVQVGDDGVLLVDTGSGGLNEDVLAAIRELSDGPIRFILNTHAHADHMGGNESLAAAGSAGGGGRASDAARPGALVIAHQAVLEAVSAPTGQEPPMPVGAWPTEGYTDESKEVFFNGEAIQLLHVPAAHTGGDSLVFFRRSDVIVTGDLFVTTSYPVIDLENGGSLNGIIDGLNRIIDITIPQDWQEGGTMVISGHGRLADEADVVEYRDTVTIIRDRIEDMIDRGMTLDEVQAARPTFEYDGRYGSESGPWTTRMFVEAAYRDLSGTR